MTDEDLERIEKEYSTRSGKKWSTGKVKQRLVGVVHAPKLRVKKCESK
jgi:hypothetical protein